MLVPQLENHQQKRIYSGISKIKADLGLKKILSHRNS
jgi:hypothetical protein